MSLAMKGMWVSPIFVQVESKHEQSVRVGALILQANEKRLTVEIVLFRFEYPLQLAMDVGEKRHHPNR